MTDTDIIRRLRTVAIHGEQERAIYVMEEAAVEIEQLRALNDILTKALAAALERKP